MFLWNAARSFFGTWVINLKRFIVQIARPAIRLVFFLFTFGLSLPYLQQHAAWRVCQPLLWQRQASRIDFLFQFVCLSLQTSSPPPRHRWAERDPGFLLRGLRPEFLWAFGTQTKMCGLHQNPPPIDHFLLVWKMSWGEKVSSGTQVISGFHSPQVLNTVLSTVSMVMNELLLRCHGTGRISCDWLPRW